jgi:hypothetical protein
MINHHPDLSLTPEALAIWNEIAPFNQAKVLNNIWCAHCRQASSLSLQSMWKEGQSLILKGHCQTCGGPAVRVLELEGDRRRPKAHQFKG